MSTELVNWWYPNACYHDAGGNEEGCIELVSWLAIIRRLALKCVKTLLPLPLVMVHNGKVRCDSNRHLLSCFCRLSARVPAVWLRKLFMEERTHLRLQSSERKTHLSRNSFLLPEEVSWGSNSEETKWVARKPFMITEKSFSVPNQKVINSSCSPHRPR